MVAQTVPVVALALVLETRAFARQVRSKQAFAAMRTERIYFVASTTLAAALLVVTLVISLGALQSETPYPEVFSSIAMYFLAFSFGAVVINPLVALLPALTSDVRADRKLAAARRRTQDPQHGEGREQMG